MTTNAQKAEVLLKAGEIERLLAELDTLAQEYNVPFTIEVDGATLPHSGYGFGNPFGWNHSGCTI